MEDKFSTDRWLVGAMGFQDDSDVLYVFSSSSRVQMGVMENSSKYSWSLAWLFTT